MASDAFDAAGVGDALGWAPTRGTDMGHVVATPVTMGLNCHNSRGAAARALVPDRLSLHSGHVRAEGLDDLPRYSLADC